MDIVRTSKLGKVYDERGVPVQALKDVDIEVGEGEFLSLVGPSGSGKTTLLNLIGCLDAPSSGNIWLDGEGMTGLTMSELSSIRLSKIGFVFQEFNLIPVLSAVENVEYIMLLQGIEKSERRKRATEILVKLGIGELANRRPMELSGGQQQRVAVARAIVSRPRLVLADEPTANLDSKTGEDLLDLMRNLNEKDGITFVFSTHDQMVMEKARRMIRLRDGMVVSE
jgi:putative ABC transport system ATP-binding protein